MPVRMAGSPSISSLSQPSAAFCAECFDGACHPKAPRCYTNTGLQLAGLGPYLQGTAGGQEQHTAGAGDHCAVPGHPYQPAAGSHHEWAAAGLCTAAAGRAAGACCVVLTAFLTLPNPVQGETDQQLGVHQSSTVRALLVPDASVNAKMPSVQCACTQHTCMQLAF